MTREEAIKVLRTESVELGGAAPSVCRFLEALDMAVKALDAVPVVRCKDCVNGTVFVNKQGAEYVDCVLDDYSVRKPTDYCSYGERKEGADNEP